MPAARNAIGETKIPRRATPRGGPSGSWRGGRASARCPRASGGEHDRDDRAERDERVGTHAPDGGRIALSAPEDRRARRPRPRTARLAANRTHPPITAASAATGADVSARDRGPGALDHEERAVPRAPRHERPRGAMPQAAEQEHDDEVGIRRGASPRWLPSSGMWEVTRNQFDSEMCQRRQELTRMLRAMYGVVEVLEDAEPEHAHEADRHVGVSPRSRSRSAACSTRVRSQAAAS